MSSGKKNKPAYHQYFKMCQLQDTITDKKSDASFLDTFSGGDWLYIYFTTHDGANIFFTRDNFIQDIPKFHSVTENNMEKKYGSMLILNREASFNYLGLVRDPYMACRNLRNVLKK